MTLRSWVAAALLIAIACQSGRVNAEGAASTPVASGSLHAAPRAARPETPLRAPSEILPRLGAVRVSSPPVLDGRLDDPAWASSPGTSDFTQQVPYDGKPPSEHTTLRVVYDDEAVYFGFDCDQVRTPVVGRLTRRDEDSESDWVWVEIDSRRDARTAYVFAVNVKGVLSDGILHDGTTWGLEWDENWEARTALTPRGWSAELRIPFRVLRFTPGLPVQDWGLWASRFIGVSQEKDDWPYIPRDAATPIPFFGRLTDLRHLAPGGTVELRPFVLGEVRRQSADASLVNHGIDAAASAGLDLKLHVTQSLTLDAAINPDFAQVEADQLILNLNNYEIQYPEKRPLFLEGADLFATPLGVLYSRRIGSSPPLPTLDGQRFVRIQLGSSLSEPMLRNDPSGVEARLVEVPRAATIYGALKFSGRFRDAWTVGLLSALSSRNDFEVQNFDRQAGLPLTGPLRHTVEPLTAFNVFRLRREIGARTQIGVVATATTRFEDTGAGRVCPTGEVVAPGIRCFRDATVGGLDATWRSPKADYVASGQLVGSAVREGRPELQWDGTSIGSGDRDIGGWVRLAKEGGRTFLAEGIYTGLGRRLMYNDLGYMARQNLHEGKVGLELRNLDPGRLTLERHLRLDLSMRRNLDGLDLGMLVELGLAFRTKGFWNLRASLEAGPSYFDDREIRDGSALERARFVGGKIDIVSDPTARFGVGLKSEVRFLANGVSVDAQAPLILRLLPQFAVELTPQAKYSSGEQRFVWHSNENYSENPADPRIFGRLLGRSASVTLRIGYTFTPRLSLQTFAQLFLAAEHYTDFRGAPRSVAHVRAANLAPLAAGPTDADSESAALNVNVVLRWEYRLGSTLFIVYSRSQTPDIFLGSSQAALRLSAIGNAPAVDTLLAKLSFWWAS